MKQQTAGRDLKQAFVKMAQFSRQREKKRERILRLFFV